MITIAIIHIDKKILSEFGSCSFSDSGLFLLSPQKSYQGFLLLPCWFTAQNVFSDPASNLENSLKFFLILSFFLDFKASSLKCKLLIGKACETLPPNFLTEPACCFWFGEEKTSQDAAWSFSSLASDNVVSWFCMTLNHENKWQRIFEDYADGHIWITKPTWDRIAHTVGQKVASWFWEQNIGDAEVVAGGRMGPGRLQFLLTAPEACFSVWSCFPALSLPKLHLFLGML